MDVELDGRLRLALVGIPTGSAHGAVGKRRQHAALHVAAGAAMLGLGQEGVAVAVARRPLPNWTDQVEEAVDRMALPAGAGGIEGRGRVGRLCRVNTHKPIVCMLSIASLRWPPNPRITPSIAGQGCIAAKVATHCPLWVISDRSTRQRRSRHVRFAPKADK